MRTLLFILALTTSIQAATYTRTLVPEIELGIRGELLPVASANITITLTDDDVFSIDSFHIEASGAPENQTLLPWANLISYSADIYTDPIALTTIPGYPISTAVPTQHGIFSSTSLYKTTLESPALPAIYEDLWWRSWYKLVTVDRRNAGLIITLERQSVGDFAVNGRLVLRETSLTLIPPTSIPEPTSAALLLGLIPLAVRRRR